jgi:diacylglycerol kinase family enzyme
MALPPHLSPDREIYVIISTKSGSQGAEEYYRTTLQPLLTQTHSIKHQVHITTSATSISELCSTTVLSLATKGVKQTILLLSGDGGIVDVVNALSTALMRDTHDSRAGSIFIKPTIALFPLGTANALAWSSGVATDPIKTLLTGTSRALPQFEAVFSPGASLVTDEGRGREALELSHDDEAARTYGAVVFSWGLHASLVAMSDTAEMRRHGVARFKMAAESLLGEDHTYRAKVRFRRQRHGDWETLRYPSTSTTTSGPGVDATTAHKYVLAPLVSRLEETFRISPATTPLSNALRLVAVDAASGPAELMRVLTLAYQDGAHVQDPSIVYEEIDGLRIEFQEDDARWRQVCVDGKIIEVPRGGWAEVNMLPAMGMDGRRVVELVVPT